MAEVPEPKRPSLSITPKGGQPVKPSSPGLPKFQVSKSPFTAHSSDENIISPSAGPSKGPPLPPPAAPGVPPSNNSAATAPPQPPAAPKLAPTLTSSIPGANPAPSISPAITPAPIGPSSSPPLPNLADVKPASPAVPSPLPSPSPAPSSSPASGPKSPSPAPNPIIEKKPRPSIFFLLIDFLVFGASVAGCVLLFLNY